MKYFIFLLLTAGCALAGQGQTSGRETDASLVPLAKAFLSALDESQRKKAVFGFADAERHNWHFVPKSRNGIPLKELDKPQQAAAFSLLKASLSQQGYEKAAAIIQLENVLREVENRPANDEYRDASKYFFTIFGTPSDTAVWGWRLEGHHLALNFSSASGGLVSATPSFMGSNPAVVPLGKEQGKQILKAETQLGFALLRGLSAGQRSKAVISEIAPADIITGNDRKAQPGKMAGVAYADLDAEQKKLFMDLLNVYVNKYPFSFADELMAKIKKAGLDKLHFAWAGSQQPGAGHYYRIHGPMLLIEYDNTQNNANHVHTVIRDLDNDFAEDFLKEHYAKAHKK
jgi:Protein of unknown function (DUF3500)